MRTKIFRAAVMIALLAGPAYGQTTEHVPGYREAEKDKTPQQKAADKDAAKAYSKSLSNIPDKPAPDPWSIARPADAPPAAAKAKPKTKTSGAAN
jgi:hypothetical protein